MVAARPDSRQTTLCVPALIAAVIAFAMDVVYVLIIRWQGNFAEEPGRVVFVASYLAAIAIVGFAAGLARRIDVRLALLGAATAALFGLGVLAAFSIGVPLLFAGVLTAAAWIRTTEPGQPLHARRLAWALAGSALVVLVFGIALT